MNGERKLNDASHIANAKEPVHGSFKNKSNGTILHIRVPIIHGSWDAMPNVCRGFQWKLYNLQGKFFFMLVLLHKVMLMKKNN